MNASRRLVAIVIFSAFSLTAAPLALAAPGQSFPDTTCTCKGCGPKGKDGTRGDVTGKCPSVCKDKTVYDKGSEPHDYCKAAARKLPRDAVRAVPLKKSR